jgi:16S rRNA processing protein RimM
VQLVIGRIGRAHGVRGEVAVEVRTDDPDVRYAEGARLDTDPAERGPLTVERARWHSGRLLVAFTEIVDRDAAEALRGTLLVVDSATSAPTEDPDEFWDHDLVDLRVTDAAGTELGVVLEVLHLPAQDVLVVRRGDGEQALVPFVSEIVPEVDVANGRVVVAAPDGLFDLNDERSGS